MGADHVKPERLNKVVKTINNERLRRVADNVPPLSAAFDAMDNIKSMFDIVIPAALISRYSDVSYSVEEKYDGYSYINDGGRFFSKRLSQAKGNEGTPVEKTSHMPRLAAILKIAYDMCGCDLHGELYIPGGISDDVTKILGCDADKAIAREDENIERYGIGKILHYRLLDIRKFNGVDITRQPYYVRRSILEYVYDAFIRQFDNNGLIQLAEILYDDPRNEFRRIVRAGGEGIIMKDTHALYVPGKKPAGNWIKGKKKVTADVVITGFNDGTGKNKSLFGSFEFGLYIDGKLTKVGSCSSGLSDAIRQRIAADPNSYIGTVMEITAIQESVKSCRNAAFIRLRDDKDAIECTPMCVMMNDNLVNE